MLCITLAVRVIVKVSKKILGESDACVEISCADCVHVCL